MRFYQVCREEKDDIKDGQVQGEPDQINEGVFVWQQYTITPLALLFSEYCFNLRFFTATKTFFGPLTAFPNKLYFSARWTFKFFGE